jgi:hypothetical protein
MDLIPLSSRRLQRESVRSVSPQVALALTVVCWAQMPETSPGPLQALFFLQPLRLKSGLCDLNPTILASHG